jgi:indoleamine 2,3-dioxygenase
MLPAIPVPEDYGVSTQNGFLPAEGPLEVLPDPYYRKWEAVVLNLQALLLSKRLREVINDLQTLSTSRLKTEPEWRRAHMLLAFMSHAYIWGGDSPEEVGDLLH